MVPGRRFSMIAFTMVALLALTGAAVAGEATGTVVFVDDRNHGLLIEVPQGGGGIPGAKEGETFTFIIPSSLLEMAKSLRAGQPVTVKFEEKEKDGPRMATAITKN